MEVYGSVAEPLFSAYAPTLAISATSEDNITNA